MELKPVKSGWYNAFRPWTLHGAIVPVVIGAVVAYHDGHCDWLLLALALIGACLLQSAANILNTYGDYVKGIDNVENHSRSPELVSGTLKPRQMFYMGMACLAVTAVIGLYFIYRTGPEIFWFGIAGMIGAACYTIGPAYKYYGLGQLSVFLMMGFLMSSGTYWLLTGDVTWEVILISIPNAMLITAVLGGNEMRDFYSDKESGIKTLSIMLGYNGGMFLYRLLCTLPYVTVALLVIAGVLPYATLLTFVSLILWWPLMQNTKKAKDDKKCSMLLVPLAFRLNWVFGGLLAIGYIVGYYVL